MENSTKLSLTELIKSQINSNHLIKPTLSHDLDQIRLVRVIKSLIINSENIDESHIMQVCEEVFPHEKRHLLDDPEIFISPLLSHIRNAKEIIEAYLKVVENE
jgi:hypothetical protein